MLKNNLTILVLAPVFTFLFFVSSVSLSAQQRDWRDMMQDPDVNFFDVRAAFEAEFPENKYPKGSGWKKFRRWEAYYEGRVSTSGKLPDRERFLREVRAYAAKALAKNATGGDWTEVGPINKPANGTGQPNGNGRLNCIAFHPTDENTFYVGSPSGAMWETNDAGDSWTKRSDGTVRLGVSSIVIHPTQPNIMYIGTGDRDGGQAPGYGVWRSLDGGVTMQPHNNGMGNRTVNEIIMHPANPDVMIAATSNSSTYRTTDGGANWVRTNVGENFKDLAMHPTNPDIMYGAGDRVFKSTNNGVSWSQVSSASGFTASGHNRTALAVTPANPDVVYALASGGSGFVGLYKSSDAGVSWTLRSSSPNLNGYDIDGDDSRSQSWYDQVLAVDPNNENNLFFGAINTWKSVNGGQSWTISSHWVGTGLVPSVHADHHAMDFNPLNGKLYDGNDGGLHVSDDLGETWTEKSDGLAIAQVYKIGTAQTQRDLVINGYQDNGTSIYYPGSGWRTEIGGDGFECAYNPTNDNIVFGSLYYGEIRRSTNGGASFRTIAEDDVNGITESGAFSAPFTLDPNDPETIYLGMVDVWRSTDVLNSFPSWTKISSWSSRTMQDIAVSPVNSDFILACNDDGQFRRTTNGSAANPSWTNIKGNLPLDDFIKDITYDPLDQNTAYLTMSGNVYKTTDNGDSWEDISGTLPNISANCLVVDKDSPVGAIYLGMDVGVYYIDDNQGDWTLFSSGLPNVEVTDLEIYYNLGEGTSTIYAGTYGAGMWKSPLMDVANVSPLARFDFSLPNACEGNVASMIDNSLYSPTSWSWSVTPSNVSFANGTTAASRNPDISFPESGTYMIELVVTNDFGVNQLTKELTVGEREQLPLENNFEGGEESFTVENPDNGITWGVTSVTSTNGDNTQVLRMDNYDYNSPGALDYYRSAALDATIAASLELSFQLAYAPYSTSLFDGLRVEISSDCGDNWEVVYDKADLELSTTGDYFAARFEPGAADWRLETVDLTDFAGEVVEIRFVNVNGWGNYLYIDDVVVTGATVLPIRLNNLTGHHVPKVGNELQWVMEEEEPGLSFRVQRFHERSREWRFIGEEVEANGGLGYTLTDRYPEFGSNLYRIELWQSGEVLDYSGVVEIETKRVLRAFEMSPNPTSGLLTLRTQSLANGIQDLRLIDATGRVVLQRDLEIREGEQQHTLDLTELPVGIYFLQVGERVERVVRE